MKKIYSLLFLFLSVYSFGQIGQIVSHSYTFDGQTREFNIYVPSSYDSNNDTLPLVLFLHGLGGDMSNFSGLAYKAQAEKYIMVVPQALSDPNFGTTWHSGAGTFGIYPNANIDDVGFINSLIDTVSSWYQVNENRIYSTGFSMGGFMTNRLGCELSDRFAAIASVAGTIGNEILSTCNPNNIVPSLHIHSVSDQTVPFNNNTFGNDADDLISFWVNNNNCNGTIDTVDLSSVANDGFFTTKYLYHGGDLNSEVEFYKLDGPAHNESFFNATSGNDFDAIEVIWDFFSRHENKSTSSGNNGNGNSTNVNDIHLIQNSSYDIFPNPAVDDITLNFDQEIELASISISNTLGKTIETKYFDKAITKCSFDISNKAQGIYFFQIKDLDGNMNVLRFYKK